MDLYQLRYFLEVARELSFTRAAANLHVSPSAVSRSVALLERSVRKKLFARTKRQVALTVSGEALRARAQRIFDEVEAAQAEISEEEAPALLRIASREMITNYLLPGALAELQRRYPATRCVISALDPADMAADLKKDRIDVGFFYTALADVALQSRRLGGVSAHVYASKDYLRRKGPFADLSAVLRHPFIAPALRGADGFPDARHPRRVQFEAEFLETHRRFVLEGLCVGVLPDLVVSPQRRSGEVVALPGPPIRREIHGFLRRDRPVSKAVELVLGGVRRSLRAWT